MLQSVADGIIDTGTGKQGENGNDQIGDGRAFPQTGRNLRKGRGEQRCPEVGANHTGPQFGGQHIDRPCQQTAQGADPDTCGMDVKENGEADAAYKCCQALHCAGIEDGIGDGGSTPNGNREAPGGGGTQGNAHGNQQHLHNAVDAGVGIPVDDVTHGIGEQQTWNQDHQRADDGCVHIVNQTKGRQRIGNQRGYKGGCNGGEELVCLQIGHQPANHTHCDSADTGPKTVGKAATEEKGKAETAQEIAQKM